jgi:hypothetical protein
MLPIIFRGHQDAGCFAHALGHHDGSELLDLLPGNQPTSDARYACLVPVRDYWRMSSELTAQQNAWHYSSGIDPEIIADTKAGRALIVFDLSNEGPDYWPAVFDELYQWIERNSLPPGRVTWLAQNRALAEHARTVSGGRSALIHFEYYDFFLKMIAWSFSPRGSIDAQIYGNDSETAIAQLLNPASKDSLLLCLNATPRLQRILAVAALLHHNLLHKSQVSFGGFQYAKPGTNEESAIDYAASHPELTYLSSDIRALASFSPLAVDGFAEKGNDLITKIDPRAYERTYFSLVTESDFSDGAIDRITEKTAKGFCMGHPTLVVGNPKSIAHMTKLGFQDWDGVIDRAHEAIPDPAQRFAATFREVLRQVECIQADPVAWLCRTREVSTWNIRHTFRGGMLARYTALYDVLIVDRFRRLIGM